MKAYVVGYDGSVDHMYLSRGYEITTNLEEADLITFTGGADINPAIYGMKPHPKTHYWSRRDEEELAVAQKYMGIEKLKVGICRGAQLLCALNGGTLFQDVNNHANGRTHAVLYTAEDGTTTSAHVTSLHHQMLRPGKHSNYEDWATAAISTYRDLDKEERRPTNFKEGYDREIVYYPDSASFCFQGHPEYGHGECTDLFFTALDRAILRQQATIKRREAMAQYRLIADQYQPEVEDDEPDEGFADDIDEEEEA